MKKILAILILGVLVSMSFASGNGSGNNNVAATIATMPKETLSATEMYGLIQMREEEKVAKDVYITLYEKWNVQVFKNISQAEETHMSSVKALLDKYGLEDPVKSYKVGVFTDDILQKLYDDLVKEGSKSIVDALKVGATIEDLDIYDLDKLLLETDNQDIKLVYDNLRSGSENHMRAFISQLKQYNATYTPKYISQKEFEAILSSSNGNGNH